MSVAIEKIQRFLGQFGSEGEFLAWCEGQGITGVMGSSTRCLVSEAVKAATGFEEVFTVPLLEVCHIGLREHYCELPEALKRIPFHFDLGLYPRFVRSTPELVEEVKRALY